MAVDHVILYHNTRLVHTRSWLACWERIVIVSDVEWQFGQICAVACPCVYSILGPVVESNPNRTGARCYHQIDNCVLLDLVLDSCERAAHVTAKSQRSCPTHFGVERVEHGKVVRRRRRRW